MITDTDLDGVNDAEDLCPGGNDSIDSDLDTIPDYCDDSVYISNDKNEIDTTDNESDINSGETSKSKSNLSTGDYLYIIAVALIISISLIYLYSKKN